MLLEILGKHDCHQVATCTNAVQHLENRTHLCTCNAGYEGNGTDCKVQTPYEKLNLELLNIVNPKFKDINDCLLSPCPSDATCMNTQSSYECRCKQESIQKYFFSIESKHLYTKKVWIYFQWY